MAKVRVAMLDAGASHHHHTGYSTSTSTAPRQRSSEAGEAALRTGDSHSLESPIRSRCQATGPSMAEQQGNSDKRAELR